MVQVGFGTSRASARSEESRAEQTLAGVSGHMLNMRKCLCECSLTGVQWERRMQTEFVWLKEVIWEKPIYRSSDSSEADMGESSQDELGEPTAWDLRVPVFVCVVHAVCRCSWTTNAAVIVVVFTIAFPRLLRLLCTTYCFAFSQVIPCTRTKKQIAGFLNLLVLCCTECCRDSSTLRFLFEPQKVLISVSCNLLQDFAFHSHSTGCAEGPQCPCGTSWP